MFSKVEVVEGEATTATDNGKARIGAVTKAVVLDGVGDHQVMDLVQVCTVVPKRIHFRRTFSMFSGGNSWGGDYDNGYGGNIREFSQGGGPVRNSYVTERSAPYARDYGGKLLVHNFITVNL